MLPQRAYAFVFTLLIALSSNLFAAEQEPISKPKNDDSLEEVVVVGSRASDFSVITQETQKLVEMAGTLGDPLAAVFSLPGVVFGAGGGEPAVRGASPNDNRFFVDFMPAGYVFHTFTNSVFSEFILHDFQLYSSGYGPEYSNVTGAVFDISLRDPANTDFWGAVDLSMLRSGVFIEGGITDNSAFYLSARQSFIHLFIPEGEEEDGLIVQSAPRDNDYQAKYLWQPTERHKLSFSLNGASDEAAAFLTQTHEVARTNPDFAGNAKILNEFDAQNLVYDFNPGNDFAFKLGVGQNEQLFELNWGDDYFFNYTQQQQNLRARLNLPPLGGHNLSVGSLHQNITYDLKYDQILFACNEGDPNCGIDRGGRISGQIIFDMDISDIYVNDSWRPHPKLNIDMGVQWQSNNYTDEQFTNPRFAVSYALNSSWEIRTKMGKYNRLPEVEYITPQIGSPELKSLTATHYSLGLENTLDNGWSWSIETYYKTMSNIPLAADLSDADNNQTEFEGPLYTNDVEGEAYGIDLFINKDLTERWYGWIALSAAKSERTDLTTQETKDYHLDTPLILNWVMNYQKSERFNIGWRWTVRSGAPTTPIDSITRETQQNSNGEDVEVIIPNYSEDLFSKRLPTYSQLDIRFKWDMRFFSKLDGAVILDIINVLNQKNVEERNLDWDAIREDQSGSTEVKMTDTVTPGIIPAATLRVYF